MSKKLGIEEIDEKLDELDEQPERREFPPKWTPENEGDNLRGEVIDIRHIETEYGESPRALVKDREGKVHTLWISWSVLQRKWSEHDVVVGDHISLTYTGKANKARLFKLSCVKPDGEAVSFDFVVPELPSPEL